MKQVQTQLKNRFKFKLDSELKILVLFGLQYSLMLGCLTCLSGEAQGVNTEQELELIQDTDFSFFMKNPKSTWGPDPFAKTPGFAHQEKPKEKFSLQGISFEDEYATAVVNGQFISVGDVIGGRKASEIGPNYVILDKGESRIELVLPIMGNLESNHDD